MYYYPKINSFIRISKVQNHDWYEQELKEFKSNLVCFQKTTSEIIYTKTIISDSEIFYTRVLFCYYPILADRIWEENELELGILNLQGIEWRNKESKTAAKMHYNNKHNVCTQIINYMHDWF